MQRAPTKMMILLLGLLAVGGCRSAPRSARDGGDGAAGTSGADGDAHAADGADALDDADARDGGDALDEAATPNASDATDARVEAADGPDAAAAADADAARDAGAEADAAPPDDAARDAGAEAATEAGGSDVRADASEAPAPPVILNQWPTLGGDDRHSGFNAYETGHPPLSLAWTSTVMPAGAELWPVVSNGQTLFVSNLVTNLTHGTTVRLAAISPIDGKAVWKFDVEPFQELGSLGQPTVDGTHVYVSQCCGEPGTFMYALFAATGKVHWSQPFGAQFDLTWAPVVADGAVTFGAGGYGGMMSLEASNGSPIFFNSQLPQYDQWSPMLLDGTLYAYVAGTLASYDRMSGMPTWTVQVDWDFSTMATAAVSDGERIFVVSPPTLHAILPNADAPAWSVPGDYKGMVATAHGEVYALSAGQLVGHDAKTGKVLWTFAADGALLYPPAVAGHWVYAASEASVYAFDTTTKTKVWEAAPGGWLSIAGGKLFVAQKDGALSAYDLTP